jgi:phosphohistidine phosphatase
MTLTLYVLRHAKAELDSADGTDHGRDLKKRGRRAARAVGAFLTEQGEAPDLILCSTALRARETARLAAEGGSWEVDLVLDPAIYETSVRGLLERLRVLEDGPRRVLLVGHQPVLSLLVAELTGAEPAFPTGALARIDLSAAHWRDVGPRSGLLAFLVTPAVIGGRPGALGD